MKSAIVAAIALAFAPVQAIPPSSFGFPEAPNNTLLNAAFRQDNGTTRFVTVREGALFGNAITAHRPVLGLNTSAYSALSNYTGSYVVLMADPDASYPNNPTSRYVLHWLQANVSQSDNLTYSSDLTLTGKRLINQTAPVVPYRRPTPPTNSSAHRYILYAFQQPANFVVPAAYSGYNDQNRTRFNLTSFIRDARLGTPAAANYFYVSREPSVPEDFTAAPGGSYPGGNGNVITSGDPYKPTGTGSAGSPASTGAAAAMVTGVNGLFGAGLVGLAMFL